MKLGDKTFDASLKDVIYDAPKGDFPHPNTMTCKLMAGDKVLLEQEYYSVGGGFIEWKGYTPPKKGAPKYPYSTMAELLKHAEGANLSVAQLVMANEIAVSGKSEAEINAFIDKISNAMVNIVKSGLAAPDGDVARADQAEDEGRRRLQARDGRQVRARSAASAWCRRTPSPGRKKMRAATCVVTAPTGGSAGVMPAIVYAARRRRTQAAAGQDPRRLPRRGGGRIPLQAQRHAVGR